MKILNYKSIQVDNINWEDYPDFCDSYAVYAEWDDGVELTDDELQEIDSGVVCELAMEKFLEG